MASEASVSPVVIAPRLSRRREGRGFSVGELIRAGLTLQQARKLGIRIDKRRRSTHEWNVEALKQFVESLKPKKVEEATPTQQQQPQPEEAPAEEPKKRRKRAKREKTEEEKPTSRGGRRRGGRKSSSQE